MRAMILAAGRGVRMRSLTDTTPKPLLIAGSKPLIVWHIEALLRAGVHDIVINHAHLGHLIEATLGDGRRFGARLCYSPETAALETAGGIAKALAMLGQEPFLVINGDIHCRYDYAALPTLAENDLAHLVLVDNPSHHPQGDFAFSAGRVLDEGAPRLTFSGIGVYRPELFASVTSGEKAKLAPLLKHAMRAGRVSGEYYAGLWMDIGTPERLAELDQYLAAR